MNRTTRALLTAVSAAALLGSAAYGIAQASVPAQASMPAAGPTEPTPHADVDALNGTIDRLVGRIADLERQIASAPAPQAGPTSAPAPATATAAPVTPASPVARVTTAPTAVRSTAAAPKPRPTATRTSDQKVEHDDEGEHESERGGSDDDD